ncbi:period circadian protein isoform X2 [Bacillus rossius redtenbacheri]|uniref:period circadian protein isoform X2 n=1 Tax=Bacillus rossius redtenbacheri TaxID=93214 RepID=UPI002FDCB942
MEESETSAAQVSDSAYSNSCNSKSQRSNSSKYGTSNSSGSGSSGYGGHPSTHGSSEDVSQHPKDKKKKKQLVAGTEQEGLPAEASEGSRSVQSMHVALGSAGLVGPNSPGQNCKTVHTHSLQTGAGSAADISKGESSPAAEVPEPPRPASVPDTQASKEEKFSAVVSMHNGTILCTSASLTDVLGFPKDMWLGRFFIDFVHPKDRAAFSAFITAGVAETLVGTSGTASTAQNKESFFCGLRKYRGLKSNGYCVTQREVTYRPFQLSLAFMESGAADRTTLSPGAGPREASQEIFLLVTASVVHSAYKVPDEEYVSSKFVTRHSAGCVMNHVDAEAVRYLGYLPQDMLNRSVFDFYHPEDLPFFKDVYREVMKKQGLPFCSQPYRFRAQNGGYLLLETEWSSFVNPWSKKMELVIGQHRVVKGPPNPDVFSFLKEGDEFPQMVEEVVNKSKVCQEEIMSLLKETVSRSAVEVKQQVTKRCKELATFMESLVGEKSKLNIVLPQEEQSISEHSSEVMLGEISPHHDYCDSKSSTETPPSYNQLNYNDNIQRFFESRPKTTLSDESAESKLEMNRSPISTDEESKCVQSTVVPSGCSSSVAVTMDSQEAASETYRPPHLTEALLCRHNEDMEKRMVQKHREQRGKGEREGKSKENRQKGSRERPQDQAHGVKRSGSHSREGEPLKSGKYSHAEGPAKGTAPSGLAYGCGVQQGHPPSLAYPAAHPQVNLWPPFSVAPVHPTTPVPTSCVPNMGQLQQQVHMGNMGNLFPMYYLPGSSGPPMNNPARLPGQGPSEHPGPPSFLTQQVPYVPGMPGMMYQPVQPMYGMGMPSQMMYHPGGMMMLQPTLLPSPATRPTTIPPITVTSTRLLSSCVATNVLKFQRPTSQPTSVKAEPGSIMGSVASVSVKRALSESSKKDLSSPAQSCDEDDWKGKDGKADETSYSSYSFLKTDKSDESLTGKPEDLAWSKSDQSVGNPTPKPRPILRDPPWIEGVITSDLMYRYKLNEHQISDVLEADLKKLKKLYQPILVNDQLSQLYHDMELDGRTALEESLTSSGSSGEEQQASYCPFTQPRLSKGKRKRHPMEYSKLVMIFEENAPFPPPISQ